MPAESTIQPAACVCQAPATSAAPSCPMCGGGLVPMRGTWRCSRCYFALCAGCEPGSGYEATEQVD
jgi:hypothetical protein